MSKNEERIVIYTDGACDPNPGVGGWAAVLLYRGHNKELSGGESDTTNNRMEMTAAIKGLEALKRRCAVTVHTDSQYLKNGITSWLPGWKQRNWKRKKGELKNIDLWRRLDELTQQHEVVWKWVRGHAGDVLNERCDALAWEEIIKLRRTARRAETRRGRKPSCSAGQD